MSLFRPPPRRLFRPKRLLTPILLLYLILALAYGVANPLFEAPDEQWHYFTVQTVKETRRLPVVTDPIDEWTRQEAAQPPLYYVLGALLTAPIDTDDAREVVWPNPFVRLGDPSAPTNVNAFVHGPWEEWPWEGYALAAHLLRVFSTLLGLGTLLCIYGSGRVLWPAQPACALLATAMTAFLPQFLFLNSAVSNDPLIVFLSAAAIWQLLSIWQRGRRVNALPRWRLLLLGITIGLAILAKTAGLLLLAYAGLVFLIFSWLYRGAFFAATRVLFLYVGLPAAALGGWLLWRNWSLYRDPTAANQFVMIAGGDRNYTLLQVLGESGGLWTSTFAVFGWFNVRAPDWVYLLWNALLVLALVGALYGLRRSRWMAAHPTVERSTVRLPPKQARRLLMLLLAGWIVLVYGGLVTFMLRTPAAQGRLLFPALVPLALGLAYGLHHFPGRWLAVVAPAVALLTACAGLATILSTYAPPPTGPEMTIPPSAERLEAALGHGMELVAAELKTASAQPGDVVWLTLYWRAEDARVDGSLTAREATPEVVFEIYAPEAQASEALIVVGKLHSYHGGGLYPATLWPEEAIVVSRVGVRLEEEIRAPTPAWVQVGLAGRPERVTLGAIMIDSPP